MTTEKSLTQVLGWGTFWSSSSSFVLKFISIGTVFLMLRSLTVYEYGVVGLVLSVPSILGILTLPGIDDMITTDIGIEKSKGNIGGVKRLLNNYFILQLSLSLIAWTILFFGAQFIGDHYSIQSALLIRIISFVFLIGPFNSIFSVVYAVELKFFQQSLLSSFQEIFKLLVIVVAVVLFHGGVTGVIIATVLSQILALVVMTPSFLMAISYIRRSKLDTYEPFWYLLRKHGKWSVTANYFNTFNQNARLWLIKILAGTEVVALFSVAQGIVTNVVSLLPINRVIAPALPQYVEDKNRFSRMLNKSIKYQVIGYVFLGIFSFLFFPYLIYFVFPKYIPALPLFRIMIAAIIPMGFGTVTTVYFILRKQHIISWLLVLKLAIMAIMLPVAVHYFGLYGIGIEFVLSNVIFVSIRNLILKKLLPGYKLSFRSFFRYDAYDQEITDRFIQAVKKKLKIAQ